MSATDEQLKKLKEFQEEMGHLLTGPDDPHVADLHPELQKCVVVLNDMLFIKHPWVNTFTPFVGQANKIFSAKFSMMRRYLSERDFEGYIWVAIERPWRYDKLCDWWDRGRITESELREILPGIWMDVEFPSSNLSDPAYLWHEAGFCTDNEEEWEALPDPLPIYRGGRPDGIAWTVSKQMARFFAHRFHALHENPTMWRAVVPKNEVLGYLTGRGEQEVVVEPYRFDLEQIPVKEEEE